MAQRERLLHRLAAQVEHAVPQPQQLVDLLAVVDRERRRRRTPRAAPRSQTDSSISPVAIFGLTVALLAADDLALGADHVLGAQRAGQRVRLGRRLGVEDELERRRCGRAGR